jgi:hypothetical protein
VHIAEIRQLATQLAAGKAPPDTYAHSGELLMATHRK